MYRLVRALGVPTRPRDALIVPRASEVRCADVDVVPRNLERVDRERSCD